MSRTKGLYFKCDFCQKHHMVEQTGWESGVLLVGPPLQWLSVVGSPGYDTLDFCSRTCLADYFRHDISNVPEKPSEIKITEEEDRAQRHDGIKGDLPPENWRP